MVLMLGAVAMGVILPIFVLKFLRKEPEPFVQVETKEIKPVAIANDKAPNKEEPMFDKPVKVYATGYMMLGKSVIIQLSDGSRLTEQDNDDPKKPRLTLVTRNFADYDGVRLWYRPKVNVSSSVSPVDSMPANAKQTTSGSVLPGEPASEAVHATPTVFPSTASESGSWVTDRYGVQRLRETETIQRANDGKNITPTPVVVPDRSARSSTQSNYNVP